MCLKNQISTIRDILDSKFKMGAMMKPLEEKMNQSNEEDLKKFVQELAKQNDTVKDIISNIKGGFNQALGLVAKQMNLDTTFIFYIFAKDDLVLLYDEILKLLKLLEL